MNPITNISNQAYDYTHALTAAKTLEALKETLHDFRTVAADAVKVCPTTEEEFQEWRRGLALERKGKFAGEWWCRRFGCITMPEVLFQVSVVSANYIVPWGLAYLRCKEMGMIEEGLDGVATWVARKGGKST